MQRYNKLIFDGQNICHKIIQKRMILIRFTALNINSILFLDDKRQGIHLCTGIDPDQIHAFG